MAASESKSESESESAAADSEPDSAGTRTRLWLTLSLTRTRRSTGTQDRGRRSIELRVLILSAGSLRHVLVMTRSFGPGRPGARLAGPACIVFVVQV